MSGGAEWLKLLLIFSITLGIWVSFALLLNRTGNRAANRLLIALVLAMLLPPINVYSQMAFGTIDWCWILTTNLTWLYGPLLFGFIQAVRGRAINLHVWCLHIAPFVLSLIWRMSDLPIWMPGLASLLIAHVFAYLSASLWLLAKHRHTIAQMVTTHKTTYYYWLLYVAAGLSVLMLIDVFFIVRMVWFDAVAANVWRYSVALTALYIQGVAFCSLYRPGLFFNECREAAREVVARVGPARETALSGDVAQVIEQHLHQLMRTQRPYLNNDLSLATLAGALGINTHQLSSLLNDYLGESFYDFINRHRLDEALRLLGQSEQKLAMVDVAYAAGFNNKNTFYRLFKQRTGTTPAGYRRVQERAPSIPPHI